MNRNSVRLVSALVAAFSLNTSAALFDFNNLPLGTNPDGVYGDVRLTTSSWLGVMQFFGTGRGVIEAREGPGVTPSPAVWVSGFSNPAADTLSCQVVIETAFLRPVTEFGVDLASIMYAGRLTYSGIDANGNAFSRFMALDSSRAFIGMEDNPGFIHVDITAPEGGYLTGFRFQQDDDDWRRIDIGMDNLSYKTPEATGWSIIAMSALGIVVLRRRLC